MIASVLQIHTKVPLLIASAVAIVALAILFRLPLPGRTKWLLAIAIALLAMAAGDIYTKLPHRGEVVVMVDLSPSTRSAAYRDRTALDARLKQLLGSRSYRLVAFAETESPLPADAKLADLPAVQTTFAPPAADAIVLFSDGRFELPASAAPIYAVIDPGLIDPADAAIDNVRVDGNTADVLITGRGPQRVLSVTSAPPLAVSPRDTTVHRIPLAGPPPVGRAELSRGDIWPENDALTFAPPQPPQRQRWWIGGNAPAGWMAVSPEALNPDMLLAPSVIALSNVAADDLSPAEMQRLTQYVALLGGGLLILGGDRSFGAGGYTGTGLDAISPLASDPPTPVTHWLLLTDSSGSMATGNRWTSAIDTIITAIDELPPADLVSAGQFAGDLKWWINASPVVDVRSRAKQLPITPPSGPTNLGPVLQRLIDSATSDLRKELLLLTDGETNLANANALAGAMKEKTLRLHVLAIGNGPALPALKQIADSTGGTYAAELDAAKWIKGAKKLLHSARPDATIREPLKIDTPGRFKLPPREVSAANRTWLRDGPLAVAGGGKIPIAARGQSGIGRVAAWAPFDITETEREALAELVARPPRDPRLSVAWLSDRVIVDATDQGKPLNGLAMELKYRSARTVEALTAALTQTAPGRYEARIDASPQPRLAVLQLAGREVDRHTISGRYAREFAGIGVDETNLRELARRTNGRLIPPAETGPILPTLWRDAPLTPWLSGLAVVLIGGALLHWKRN